MKSRSFFQRFRISFLIGLVVTLPVIATLWVVNWTMTITTGWFPRIPFPETSPITPYVEEKIIQVLALILAVVGFFLIGWFMQRLIGRRLYNMANRLICRVPVIRTVYGFLRQISEWVANRRSEVFQEVMLVQYPRKGLYSLAFITSTLPSDSPIAEQIRIASGLSPEDEVVNLFVATTPNPTSGIYLVVPRKELIPVKIDVSEAINMVMSAGALMSDSKTTPSTDPLETLMQNLRGVDS